MTGRPDDRRAQIERLIEQYRIANLRRLQRRAAALWRKHQARQVLIELEKPTERLH